MSNSITVGPINLDHADFSNLVRIEYHGKLVLTTDQLATFYECTTDNIKVNFNSNKEQFKEIEHYFKLEGATLQDFKRQVNSAYSPNFQISKFASSLYLWTEEGTARHCKMLGNARAWEVFALLEKSYFKLQAKKEVAPEASSATLSDNEMVDRLMSFAAATNTNELRDNFLKIAANIVLGRNVFCSSNNRTIQQFPGYNTVGDFVKDFLLRHCDFDKRCVVSERHLLDFMRMKYPSNLPPFSEDNIVKILRAFGIPRKRNKTFGMIFEGISHVNV